MKRYYVMPKRITSKLGVFHFLTCMYKALNGLFYSEIHFDFKNTRYIEPNMMSPIGMLFNKLKNHQNKIYLSNLNAAIKNMLLKYNFIHLSNFNNNIPQNYIKYANFNGDEVENYRKYLYEQLKDLKNIYIVSLLISNIMEIFINVKMHARNNPDKSRYGNKEVYSSGYYNKNENYVLFSISNNGWTFADNVYKKLNINYDNSVNYIKWALNNLNSTTDLQRPGGIGLKKLKELIINTKGMIIICSGKGYFSLSSEKSETKIISNDLTNSFPGTSITVKIPITDSLQNTNQNMIKQISLKELIMEGDKDVYNLFLKR